MGFKLNKKVIIYILFIIIKWGVKSWFIKNTYLFKILYCIHLWLNSKKKTIYK